METTFDTARAQIRAMVEELTALRFRLLGVQVSLPPSPQEVSQVDLDGAPDLATEMRAILAHGLLSYLDPLLRDLEEACRSRPGASGSSPETPDAEKAGDLSILGLDLHDFADATRQALRARVIRDNFFLKPEEVSGDTWIPTYTPQAAGLEVFPMHGRWFVTWNNLDAPADLPEWKRRELLSIERNPDRPGELLYQQL